MWTTTVTWSESNLGTERGGLKVGRAAEFMPGTRYQFIEHIGEPAPAGDYPLGNVDAIEPIMTLQMSRQQLRGKSFRRGFPRCHGCLPVAFMTNSASSRLNLSGCSRNAAWPAFS
jgi:hypothetical protein